MVGHLQSVHGRTYRRLRCATKWNVGNHTCNAPASISANGLEDHAREVLRPELNNRVMDAKYKAQVPAAAIDAITDAPLARTPQVPGR
jgi:hypothetical protein